jgi:hypothetical protein
MTTGRSGWDLGSTTKLLDQVEDRRRAEAEKWAAEQRARLTPEVEKLRYRSGSELMTLYDETPTPNLMFDYECAASVMTDWKAAIRAEILRRLNGKS